MGSTWLVDTHLNAEGIWKQLQPHADKNDSFLIVGITKEHSGWLTQEAWDWIKSRLAKAA